MTVLGWLLILLWVTRNAAVQAIVSGAALGTDEAVEDGVGTEDRFKNEDGENEAVDKYQAEEGQENTLSSSEKVKRRGTVVLKEYTGTPMTARPMDDEDKKVSINLEKMLKAFIKANPTTADIQKMAEDIENSKEKKEKGGGTEKTAREQD